MTDTTPLDRLLDELEEELSFDGVLCLYHFTWIQNIGRRRDERDAILRLAAEAYVELRRRHPTAWLGWVTWPDLKTESVERAAPGTEPDFILDEEPASRRLQALVLPS